MGLFFIFNFLFNIYNKKDMASTVTPSEFKVFIKEDHVINGIRTVNENLYRIPNVTNYDRRIVTVPADTNVDLINTNGLTPGPALFPSYSIAYGRITNMDDTNRLAVTFTSSNGESETGEHWKRFKWILYRWRNRWYRRYLYKFTN